MANKKLRILCLHGSRTNADVVSMQVSGFRQAFGNSAEFSWVNAPLRASSRPDQGILDFFGEEGPYFEWWEEFNRERWSYPGHKVSLPFLQNYIETQGPFDIIIGFSQGSSITHLLTAHYQAKGQKIPYKAVVSVCGGPARDGMPEELLLDGETKKYAQLKIPSIHIVGEKDDIFDLGNDLVEHYSPQSRSYYTHPDGHRFPAQPAARPMYKEIADKLRDICALSSA
ncbi:Aste57867_13629 [Aphanomyces stellatus]|uniref:Aste57867_13629 protein n=1 Tax=Aphanomyces stellatus TaxID=120398 RepID=A0A485KYN1_9STRA|nr:hypothetical protein As57867_013579 [Aphanomyces stellatus]VFT90466.1 Aste57867_13629 [Aphanomyces stellatus]